MAKAAKRPCRSAGCGGYAGDKGYCDRHQHKVKDQQQQYDKARGTAWQAGYDADWNKVRDAQLDKQPLCQHCDRRGYVVPATEVDHIKPFQGKADPLRLDPNNLQSLCHSCHVVKTNEDKRNGALKQSRTVKRITAADVEMSMPGPIAIGDTVVCVCPQVQARLLCNDETEWLVTDIVDQPIAGTERTRRMLQVSDGSWCDFFHFSNFQKIQKRG